MHHISYRVIVFILLMPVLAGCALDSAEIKKADERVENLSASQLAGLAAKIEALSAQQVTVSEP